MSTYSTNLELELPSTGSQAGQWGVTANRDMGTLIEQAVAGYVIQDFDTDSDITLTIASGSDAGGNTTPGIIYSSGTAADPVSGRNMYIECTGTITANKNLIVPSNKKLYFVYNNTTGGFSITVKVSSGTGVTVPNGKKVAMVCDGSDIYQALNYFTSLDVPSINNTPIGNTTPSSGAFTTLAASGVVSGSGFEAYLASPPEIGGSSPGVGTFTTLSATTISGDGAAITALDVDNVTAGTLTVANGGTGAVTFTSGDYLKGAGTSAVTSQTGIPAADITSGTIATARLGSGTADSTTYLRGDQTWASVSANGVGIGQSWQAVSRSVGTSYQNTTGSPIMVSVQIDGSRTFQASSDGSSWVTVSGFDFYGSVQIIIPNNHYYRVSSTGTGTILYWAELR